MQDASTNQMLFDVRTLVSELSQGHTILPGTLLLTGTPSGVGFARKPPVYLQEGDVVEIEIASIGTLRNRVVLEK
jgi:2-keto-4-pentenoate hydratase/2-oxohepta-3-ene-1,7-dioic acid hydratase in catechol pathway